MPTPKTEATTDTQEIATVTSPPEVELTFREVALFDDQQRRALATQQAAESLRTSAFGGQHRIDATEVLALAAWIIDGGDPFARKNGEV